MNHRKRVFAFLLMITALIGSDFILPNEVRPGRGMAKAIHEVTTSIQNGGPVPARQPVSGGKTAQKIVSQVDHVLLTVPDNGRALVALLTDGLGLPIVWPQPGTEWKASSGIGFGNVAIEIFHREPPAPGEAPRIARISSLALQPTDLKAALNELSLRGIAHHPAAPGPSVSGDPLPRWTTVGLKGFGHGLFLIQYNFDMDERRSRFDRALRESGGGPLGVVKVVEVAVASDRVNEVEAQWIKLLGPGESGESDLWIVGNGPKIRLVRADDHRASDIVIEVRSLRRAAQALRRLRIDAQTTTSQIRIDPEDMSGLRLVLKETRPPWQSRQF